MRLNRLMPALLVTLAASAALADTVVHKGTPWPNVTITDIKGGEVYFRTTAGTEARRPMSEITRIEITDEVALNQAEDAYRSQKYVDAAESYQKTLRSTNRAWLKDWCTVRLVESANKSNRFDLVVTGYLQVLLKDEAMVKGMVLTMPAADSQFLPAAIGQVKSTYTNAKMTQGQQLAVVDLWIKLAEAKRDPVEKQAALAALGKVDPNNPRVKEIELQKLVGTLHDQLKAKEYAKVVDQIRRDSDKFTTGELQGEALFCFAEARAGLASTADQWKDAAIDYLRVAATFPAEMPRVSESLLKAADILENKVKDAKAALTVYKKVAAEYAKQPAGQQAATAVARLEKK